MCVCACVRVRGAREREVIHFKVPFYHFLEGIREQQNSAAPVPNFLTGSQYYKLVFVCVFFPKIVSHLRSHWRTVYKKHLLLEPRVMSIMFLHRSRNLHLYKSNFTPKCKPTQFPFPELDIISPNVVCPLYNMIVLRSQMFCSY